MVVLRDRWQHRSRAIQEREPVNDIHLRPGKILGQFNRLYPDAWKQVDELRARRKELKDWPDWCFLPSTAVNAIVSKSKTPHAPNLAHHAGIVSALAGWRVTQGIYQFDSLLFEHVWKTPVSADIATEVLFQLPEWCVYIHTPEQIWQGATLHGFFAHLDSDPNSMRTEIRLVLDVTGAAGDQAIVVPIHLGKGGIAAGVEAAEKSVAPQFLVRMQGPDGAVESLSSNVAPLVSLVLYLCSKDADIKEPGSGKPVPSRPQPQKTKKGLRIFAPDHPRLWQVGSRQGSAVK
jgi:hypothetical protein